MKHDEAALDRIMRRSGGVSHADSAYAIGSPSGMALVRNVAKRYAAHMLMQEAGFETLDYFRRLSDALGQLKEVLQSDEALQFLVALKRRGGIE